MKEAQLLLAIITFGTFCIISGFAGGRLYEMNREKPAPLHEPVVVDLASGSSSHVCHTTDPVTYPCWKIISIMASPAVGKVRPAEDYDTVGHYFCGKNCPPEVKRKDDWPPLHPSK